MEEGAEADTGTVVSRGVVVVVAGVVEADAGMLRKVVMEDHSTGMMGRRSHGRTTASHSLWIPGRSWREVEVGGASVGVWC